MKRTMMAGLAAPLLLALWLSHGEGFPVFLRIYVLAWSFGLPIVLILKKLQRESHWLYAALGFASGMAYIISLSLYEGVGISLYEILVGIVFGTAGCLIALLFSLIQGKTKVPARPLTTTLR